MRRQALGERGHRRAHEAARLQHVKGAEALADEVRRRHKARIERDAAARHERDPCGAREPGRTLRRVACVGILREQHEQRGPELLVHRRKKQRHHRLRHTRARRQRAGEGLKTVLAPQLVHEGGERRGVGADGSLVHAFGGDRAPPGHRTGRTPPDLSARGATRRSPPTRPPTAPVPCFHAIEERVTDGCRIRAESAPDLWIAPVAASLN